MIKIYTSFKHKIEKEYIFNVLISDFLGIPYEIIWKEDSDCYKIEILGGNKIIIGDYFFSKYENYLTEEAIPKEICFYNDLPIIYGIPVIEDKYCGVDIFGSSFFMLTRFEEYLISEKDMYGRVKTELLLSVRFNFFDRAVVNEYTELLYQLLKRNGLCLEKKVRVYRVIPTHDIDHLFFYKNLSFLLMRLYKCIFKYRNYKQFLIELVSFLKVKLNIKKDPYDKIDYLIQLSKKYSLDPIFFFLVSQGTIYDSCFDIKKIRKYINYVLSKGYKVGIHPSFNSCSSQKMIEEEIKMLGIHPEYSRQHYLRFEVPYTWRFLNNLDIKVDSTMGFSDRIGFRCGCCYLFNTFDILEKKILDLKEMPFQVMDGALVNLNLDEAKMMVNKVISEVKKFNGNFVLIWHNSSFDVDRWKRFDGFYEGLLISSIN